MHGRVRVDLHARVRIDLGIPSIRKYVYDLTRHPNGKPYAGSQCPWGCKTSVVSILETKHNRAGTEREKEVIGCLSFAVVVGIAKSPERTEMTIGGRHTVSHHRAMLLDTDSEVGWRVVYVGLGRELIGSPFVTWPIRCSLHVFCRSAFWARSFSSNWINLPGGLAVRCTSVFCSRAVR